MECSLVDDEGDAFDGSENMNGLGVGKRLVFVCTNHPYIRAIIYTGITEFWD